MPTILRACRFFCLLAAALPAAAPRPASAQTALPLVPVFTSTQGFSPADALAYNGPRFSYTVVNSSHKPRDIYNDYVKAIIILDGKKYPRYGYAWAGITTIEPGTTWTNTIALRDFLYGAYEPGYDWTKAPLTPGLHTLSYHFGKDTYGPITFLWKSNPAAPTPPVPANTLVPVFFNTQGQTTDVQQLQPPPAFTYTYTNTTQKYADLYPLISKATMVLDGRESHPNWLQFDDSNFLAPGQSQTLRLLIREYVNVISLSSVKEKLVPLADGPHTLTYTMGGKTYGPITFLWRTHP